MIYTSPKAESGPKHFDFGIVISTISKPKEGPNYFDFGIVIYTNPKAESGPKTFRLWNRDLHESQNRKKAQTVSTLES